MPDLDIIDRKGLKGWRPPLRMLVGNASPTEVAQAALGSCAKSIRDHGGIPAYAELEAVLRQRVSGALDSESALTRIDAIEHACGHARHAMLAARAARRLVIDIGNRLRIVVPLRVALYEEFLCSLVDHALFGRFGPDFGKHYKGPREARLRSAECKEALAPELRALAVKLAADPEGRDLRVSGRRLAPRQSMAEILAQPIM